MSQGPESDGGSPAAGTPGTGDDDRRQPSRSGSRRRGGRGRGGRGGRGRSGQGQTGNGSTGDPAAASTAPAGTQPRRQNRGPSPAEQAAAGSGAAAPAAKTTGKTTGKSTGKGARQSPAGARLDDPRTGRRRRSRRWLRQVDEFSAGGLVLDFTGDVPRGALIGRTDRQGRLLWSLPKGHIEAGETAEQAAVREVEEETGIAGVILGELGVIDFWFVADGRRIHKTVRHYLMRRVGGELSDADIEVDEVAWVALPEIRAQLAYPDERGLVDTAGKMLAEPA